MVKAILLGVILFFAFCLNAEGQIVYCTDESDITRIDASTFVFNKKDQNQSSTKFIEITRGGVSIPYNPGNVACLDYYVELSKAGTETQAMDAVKFSSDPTGYLAKGCYPSTITISSEIHAIGNINLHDNSVVTNAPTMSGFQGNDVASATVLKLAFMDFGWSSAMTNVLIEEFDLKVVIKDHCNNQEKELFLPAGSWKVLETMRVIDLEGGVKVEVPDLAVCENDASKSVTASVTGITNAYTVSWAAETGSTMPNGVTYSSSGTGKKNDVFNIDPSLAAAGTYKIRATVVDDTDNSITADTVFEVKVHPALQVAITTDESGSGGVCESVPVHLSATPTGSDYTYKWTHDLGFSTDINMTTASADSSSVTGTLAGVAGGSSRKYTVEVTNTVTGCSATADTTIVVKKKPNIKLEINGSAANEVAVCAGEPVTLKASNVVAADESKTSYQWVSPASGGSTNPLTDYPTGTVTYNVKGTVDGCSMSVQKKVTINPKPDIQLTHNPDSVCALALGGSGTVDLTTVGISSSVALANKDYFQTLGGTALTTPNSMTLAVGTHNFWLVGTTSEGCKDTVAFTAKVNDLPAKPTITGGQEVCKGTNVNLSLQSPDANSTYEWKNGGGASVGTGTTLTTYAPSSAENLSVTVTDKNGCQNTSDAYAITVNELPSITFTAAPAVACAGTTVTITANITGGTAPYKNHTWTGTGVTNVASDGMAADLVLGEGNTPYSLKVTDDKGCEATANGSAEGHYLDVTLNVGGTVNIGSPVNLTTLTIKDGAAASLNSTVEWEFIDDNTNAVLCSSSNSSNSCNPTATTLTRYKVVVKDVSTGCTDWDTVTPQITPGAPLNVTLGAQPVLCYGETDFSAKYFVVKATNGLPAYTYDWTNLPGWMSYDDKGDTLKITGITDWSQAVTTSVKCKVTDRAGDSKELTLTLTVHSLTHLSVNTKVNNEELPLCLHDGTNDQYALSVAGTGAALGSVTWMAPTGVSQHANPLNISTAAVDAAGTDYKVTAVDANGCPTDTVTVKVKVNDLPTITLTVDKDTVCPGGEVLAKVADGNMGEYLWTIGGVDKGDGKSKKENIYTATKFEVERTNANGCVATADTTIQVYVPEKLVLSGDTTVCETANSLTLTASGLTTNSAVLGSGEYTWSSMPGGAISGSHTSLAVNPAVTTTYYVEGTDVHGCLTARDSIVVTVDKMPKLTVDVPTLAACDSVDLYGALTLTGDGVVKYGTTANFTGGTVISASSPKVGVSGKYYVRAENGVCKSDEDTVRVNVLKQPKLKLLADALEACEPDSVDLADNVDWTAGTGTTYDAVNLTYWDGEPGNGGSQLTSTKVYPGVTSKDYWVQGASDGCPSQKEKVTVTIHPKPVLAITGDTAVCTPTVDLNVAVNANGGLAVTKTYFSDAACTTTVGATVSTSGTYYVVGETAAGCLDTIDVTVRIKPHPAVNLTLPSDEVCKDETVQLTVNGGATGDTYSWKVNGASVTETKNTYTTDPLTSNTTVGVTVTNTDGCTTDLDTTIEVHTPVVTLAADGDCQGDAVTITATLTGGTADTYTWTGATQSAAPNEHQATLTLTSAGQPVGVEVLTTDGCKAQADSMFTGRACIVLVVQVPDTTICSTEDNVKLTAHSSGGTVTSWAWRQIAGPVTLPSLTYADSVLMLPSMTAGTYEFEVSVNGGAAKDTAHVTVEQGVEITSLVALDSCSNSVELQVVATNSTTYKWSVVKGSGTWYAVPGEGEDRKRLALDGGQTGYEVAVEVSNGGLCKASDTLSGHVYTGLTIAFQGDDTCGRDIQLPLKYQVNGVYGNIVAKYTYQPVSGTTVKDSVRITPPNSGFITGAQPGTYVLTEVYGTNAKGCVVTVNDTVKVGLLPEAELAENCLALHKDSTFNLNIANTGDFNYIWGVSQSSDGVTWTAGGPGDGTTTNTIQGKMEDKDLQYIITATDPNVAKCKASDTAYIYRIPDAPVVEIDTFEDKRHIQLKWTAAAYADNYTVWSRKWDPYCLTGKDGNVYAAEATGTNITALSWPEPQMDSLEFYYLTANRTICGTEYKSVSSDTFGYARHIADATIAISPEAAMQNRANFAFQYAFPYIFDMSRYGIQTLRDFGNYISDGKVRRPLKAIGLWERDNYYTPGLWGWVAQNYTPMFGGQWGNRGTPALPEDLKVGQCVMIDIYADSIQEFVILGALNDAADVKFDIKNVVANTSHNLFYIPLRNILLDEAIKIAPAGSTLKASLVAMGFWVFDYNNLRTVNSVTIFGQDKFSADGSPSSAPYAFKKRAGYDVLSFDAGIISGTVNMMWP